jgi:hypothetical protein
MRHPPKDAHWWLLVVVSLLAVVLWPPDADRSLAAKFVNWAVDPLDQLPTLPAQLSLSQGDDPEAVYAHDIQTQQYDALYLKGGWTRTRLVLKVAGDPLAPSTVRQVLVGIGVLTAFVAWRLSGQKT